MLLLTTTSFSASNKQEHFQKINELMNKSPYSILEVSDENNFDTKNIKTLSRNQVEQLSNDQLHEVIEKNLKEVIVQQKKGLRVVWNENIVENQLKEYFPNIYKEIKSNHLIKEEFKTNDISSYSLSGSRTQAFTHRVYSYLGFEMFSIRLQLNWSWDVARVHSVQNIKASGSTKDSVYSYIRPTYNRGYYTTESSGTRVYKHTFKALFTNNIIGGNAYPEIGIELNPGFALVTYTKDGI